MPVTTETTDKNLIPISVEASFINSSALLFFEEDAFIDAEKNIFKKTLDKIRGILQIPSFPILIIHDNDPDGYASATLLQHYIQRRHLGLVEIETIAVGHGKPFQELNIKCRSSEHIVIILDQECSQELFDDLSKSFKELIVIDHHPKTTLIQEGLVIADERWSTTALVSMIVQFGERLFQHALLAALVNHYDHWNFGEDELFDELVKNFIQGIRFKNNIKNDFDRMVNLDYQPALDYMDDCIHAGRTVRSIQKKTMESIFHRNMKRGLLRCNIDNEDCSLKIGLVFHSDIIDELADYCLRNDQELDAVAIVYLKDIVDGFKVSLRSRKDNGEKPMVNVSKIAALFDGGGHANASAFTSTSQSFSNFLSLIEEHP